MREGVTKHTNRGTGPMGEAIALVVAGYAVFVIGVYIIMLRRGR